MRARALILSPEAPYPMRGGGALRTAALLNYLAGRYEVDAIFFREPGRPDPREALPVGLVARSMTIELPAHSRSSVARLLRNLGRARRGVPPLVDRFAGFAEPMPAFCKNNRYALGVIEHLWCAPYAHYLNEFCDSMVLDLHNVESRLHERRAATSGYPISALHARFAASARALERRWLPRFDRVLAASQADAELARSIAPQARVEVYRNTIPCRDCLSAEAQHQVAFSGNLEYDPNQAGVRWFAREVWPRIAARHRDLVWVLIGRNPDAIRRDVAREERVKFTGEIEDAVAELARSLVAVVPLKSGSGTRIKILEAWAAAVPVVSTSVGAEGLPGREGEHWFIRDTAVSFADAVSSLIDSPDLARRIGTAGRALFEAEFTWEAGWKQLAALGI